MSNPSNRVIENPILKDRITFLKTSAETGGEFLLMRVELLPGGGIPLHYHATFSEKFEVVDGRLDIMLNGQHYVLKPGESIFIPLKTNHRFFSTFDAPVTFITEVRPARTFEQSLRVSYGLACDGKTTKQGLPKNLLLLGLHLQLVETYLPSIPFWIQRFGGGLLAFLGKLLGQDKAFQKYL